jgi:hypothetical protein
VAVGHVRRHVRKGGWVSVRAVDSRAARPVMAVRPSPETRVSSLKLDTVLLTRLNERWREEGTRVGAILRDQALSATEAWALP